MSSPSRLAVVLHQRNNELSENTSSCCGKPVVRRQINIPEKAHQKKKGGEVKQVREQKCSRGKAQSLGQTPESDRESSRRQKRGSSEKSCGAEDHMSGSPRGRAREAKVQSQGCFHVFHGSLPGHLIEKILNLTTSNVQRGSDGFKSIQLIPA